MPCESGFDPSSHLSWGDLVVDVLGQPSVMSVRLKASKTDPFWKGITLFIGKVSSALCLVSAMLAYLSVQGRQDGPLFWFQDGKPLTRQRFVSVVRGALVKPGIQAQLYAGHSLLQQLLPGGRKTLSSAFEEPGLPGGHKDSKAAVGHVFSHTVVMSVYCVIQAIPGPSFCFVLFCILHVLSCHCPCVESLSTYLSHIGEVWGS